MAFLGKRKFNSNSCTVDFIVFSGFDPSFKAGILKDVFIIKHYGRRFFKKDYNIFAINSSLTIQNDTTYYKTINIEKSFVEYLDFIKKKQDCFKFVKGLKIGLITSYLEVNFISELIDIIKTFSVNPKKLVIILDPIVKSSTQNVFWQDDLIKKVYNILFPKVNIATPNIFEIIQILDNRAYDFTELPLVKIKEIYLHYADMLRSINKNLKLAITGGDLYSFKNYILNLYFNSDTSFKFYRSYKKLCNTHGTGCTFSTALLLNYVNTYNFIESSIMGNNIVMKEYKKC